MFIPFDQNDRKCEYRLMCALKQEEKNVKMGNGQRKNKQQMISLEHIDYILNK